MGRNHFNSARPVVFCGYCEEQRAWRHGICRDCYRELLDIPPAVLLEGESPAPAPPPIPRRVVVVDGIEYEVTYDGSMEGARARGIPMGHERGRHYDPNGKGRGRAVRFD